MPEEKDSAPEEKKPEATAPAKAAPVEQTEEEKLSHKEKKYKQQVSFLEADLAKMKNEAEQWKNKYYEAYADLANTRKSLERDHDNMVRYRSQGFIEKVLPALDSFELAFRSAPQNPEVAKYAQGFRMILTQLEQALRDEGVSFIEPKQGDRFDANKMHAIQTVDGDDDNIVASAFVRGYVLHDRLIRPAMVIVTKKKEPAEPKADGSAASGEDAKPLPAEETK